MMQKRNLAAFVLVAALVAVALAAPPAPEVEERIRLEILPKVAELRELQFKNPVPVHVRTTTDVAAYVRRAMAEEMSDEEIDHEGLLLMYLGLAEPGTDLHKVIIDTYSGGIAGYYDDDEKSFSIVKGSSSPGVLDDMTIAHELTHALQDQHFNLGRLHKAVGHSDDAALALSALAEGDASEIMIRYMTGTAARSKAPSKDYASFLSVSTGSQSIPGMPMILSQNMVFPYTYGARFLAALVEKGGPEAVNRAFKDPPTSTEQIMNPEKYFAREDPLIISLPDLSADLGDGWRFFDEGALGQFNLGIYLSSSIGTWNVDQAIEPWNGDCQVAYIPKSGLYSDVIAVLYSTWDSPAAARAFALTYRRLIETRFPEAKFAYAKGDVMIWTLGDRIFYVRSTGNDVLSVENAPREEAATILTRTWDGARKITFDAARKRSLRQADEEARRKRAGEQGARR